MLLHSIPVPKITIFLDPLLDILLHCSSNLEIAVNNMRQVVLIINTAYECQINTSIISNFHPPPPSSEKCNLNPFPFDAVLPPT